MILEREIRHLPLFPLPRTVFFPKTILPLHVFEPRYRTLVADVAEGKKLIGIPLLKPGYKDNYEGCPAIFSVFGFGELIELESLQDGRYNILLKGLGKAELLEEILGPRGYRIAAVRLIQDPDENEIRRLKPEVKRLREKFLPLHPIYPCLPKGFREALSLLEDPETFCHTISMHFLENPALQQRLLETASLQERICELEKLLGEEGLRHLNCSQT